MRLLIDMKIKKASSIIIIAITLFLTACEDLHDISESQKPYVQINKSRISEELSLLTIRHPDVGLKHVKLTDSLADRYRFALNQGFNTGKNNECAGSVVTIYLFFHELDEIDLEISDFEADGYTILGKEFY